MNSVVHLRAADVVVERPFTHPDHLCVDRAVVCRLIDELCWELEKLSPAVDHAITHFFPGESLWQKRLIIPNPSRLFTSKSLTIVGFFGRLRLNIDPAVRVQIAEGDRQLVGSFARFPAVLAYSTRLLVDELNYANLVVLDSETAIQQWRDFPPHPHIADLISPNYYEYVRIYNGRLPVGGLQNSSLLQFVRVKYWDYRVTPTWHGVRSLA